jgi:VIT1/CCC1 family predicted Fe2+/Mn2+ transporter
VDEEELAQKTLQEIAYVSAKDELTDYHVYKKLSEPRYARNKSFSETLQRLAGMEYKHYEFWSRYCPDRKGGVSGLKVNLIVLLRVIFGVTFAVRFLERNEAKTIRGYKSFADSIPTDDRKAFDEMIADEEEHERDFAGQFDESRVRYISFVVLGLADALVEIAGIHAGSLGIYDSTELAGLAGIIAGAAASMAMASAAYAQAKTSFKGSAALSAVYTGMSYFVTALVLATPYFLTRNMFEALFSSLAAGILLVLFTSFYGSIVSSGKFRKDFVEITSIMLGATVALYLLGTLIRFLTGMTI